MNINKLILEDFFENHIDEAVRELSTLTDNDILSLIKNLSKNNVNKIFSMIESYRAINILESLEIKESAEILNNIPSHAAVIIMRQFHQDKLNSILAVLPEKQAVLYTSMLYYDELSVGSFMNSNIFTLTEDLLIKDALEDIKRYKGTVPGQIFIITRNKKLSGVINLYQLIRENPNDDLKALIDKDVPNIYPQINVKSIFNHQGWQTYYSLPVTDGENNFLGAITLEIIRNFIDKKSSKDFKQFSSAGTALGELYRIGLSGLLHSAAEITTKLEK